MTLISDDVGEVLFKIIQCNCCLPPCLCRTANLNKMLKRKRGFFELTFCLTEGLLRTRIHRLLDQASAEQNKILIEN